MVAQPLSVAETGDRARGCCYAPEPPRWHKIIASFIPGNDLIAGSTPDIGASIKEKGGELVDHGGGEGFSPCFLLRKLSDKMRDFWTLPVSRSRRSFRLDKPVISSVDPLLRHWLSQFQKRRDSRENDGRGISMHA